MPTIASPPAVEPAPASSPRSAAAPAPAMLPLMGAVFAASLVTYLLTLAPTVTGEDSGELISAAYTLGIPHPPGYPLWCIVTRIFMLLPIGDPAWRANFGSAFAAAAACAVTVALLVRLGVRPLVAVASALLLAFSSTLWSQAVIAEVYGLTALLTVGLLYCLVAWRQTVDLPEGNRWMMAAALLTTLSLGAHHTVLLLSPLILVFVVWVGGRRLLDPMRLSQIAGCLVAGLSVQLYLPIRAKAEPAMNWGHPDTWERFWYHVKREQYPSLLGAKHTLAASVGQVKAVGAFLLGQWTWPLTLVVVAIAVFGLVTLARRDRPFAAWLFLWTAVMSVGFAWLLNFPLDQEGLHVAEVFFIPAWFSVVIFFAVGVDALAARLGEMPAAGLAGAMAVAALIFNWSSTTMHGNDVAKRYAKDILDTASASGQQKSILFTSADYEAFPVAYLQIVEGYAPEVLAVDEQRDIDRALKAAGLSAPSSGRIDDADVARLMKESTVPIYSTRVVAAVPGTAVHPVGLLYRTFTDAKAAMEAPRLDEAAWKKYAPMPDGPWRGDWSTASMLLAYEVAKARSLLAYHDDPKQALALIERAANRLPGDPVHQYNMAALLARANQQAASLPYFERSIVLRPDYRDAHYFKITTLINMGRWEDAQEAYARASQQGVAFGEATQQLEDSLLKEKMARPKLQQMREAAASSPRDAGLQMRLGAALFEFNHFEEAEQAFKNATQAAPTEPLAWRGLGMVEARLGHPDAALEAWNNVLRLDPKGKDAESLKASIKMLEARRGASR